MFNTIEEYQEALKKEMRGSDAALVQDALADAREHLSLALEAAREKTPDLSEAEALKAIIDEYGTPEETAAAYREIERRTSPSLKQAEKPQSFWGRLFGVYVDARTWRYADVSYTPAAAERALRRLAVSHVVALRNAPAP